MHKIHVPIISMMFSSSYFVSVHHRFPTQAYAQMQKSTQLKFICRNEGKLKNSLLHVHVHLHVCEIEVSMHLLINCIVTCTHSASEPNCKDERLMDMMGPFKTCNNFASKMLLSGRVILCMDILSWECDGYSKGVNALI